jgi:hypothetical protein
VASLVLELVIIYEWEQYHAPAALRPEKSAGTH